MWQNHTKRILASQLYFLTGYVSYDIFFPAELELFLYYQIYLSQRTDKKYSTI